jgi:hypothetical protein
MRSSLILALILSTRPGAPLRAQTDFYVRAGLTYSTDLIKDFVFQEITVRPGLAPTLTLGASLPMTPRARVGLEGSLTTSGYHSTEADVETDLGTLRTGSLLLGLEGPLAWRISWRGGLGVIHYWPAEDSGIFLQGGSTRFLAGGGLDYRSKVMSGWDLLASLRYDFHRFSTEELRLREFAGSQGVQRISASLGLARGRP